MSEEEKFGFIGPHEIRATVETMDETPGGDIMMEVYYEGIDEHDTLPKKVFEMIKTDEPKDFNYVRDVRIEPLLKELMAVCLEHDLPVSDANHLVDKLSERFSAVYDRATSFLWTGDDKKYTAGVSPLHMQSLMCAEKILKSIPNDKSEEKTETESAE